MKLLSFLTLAAAVVAAPAQSADQAEAGGGLLKGLLGDKHGSDDKHGFDDKHGIVDKLGLGDKHDFGPHGGHGHRHHHDDDDYHHGGQHNGGHHNGGHNGGHHGVGHRQPYYHDGHYYYDDGYYDGRWYDNDYFYRKPSRCERERYCCDNDFKVLGSYSRGFDSCHGGSWVCCDGGHHIGGHLDYYNHNCHPDYYHDY